MILEDQLKLLLEKAMAELKWPPVAVSFSIPKQKEHGDFATNVAFGLAKVIGRNPREIAQQLVAKLKAKGTWYFFAKQRAEMQSVSTSLIPQPKNRHVPKKYQVPFEKVEVAGAGFINFYLRPAAFFTALREVLKQGKKFGQTNFGQGKKVILEFVSANPTGPLNIVSARAAAVGDTLANLLAAVGYKPYREYYVNDVGGQIDLFVQSLEARYRQALGEEAEIPKEGYHGDYLKIVAEGLAKPHKKKRDASQLRELGLEGMIASQQKSLKNFGVEFDQWFRQSQLIQHKNFDKTLKQLESKGYLYEQEGALFFKSTEFGDDKDRVVRKQDGEYTYFASDIVYHHHKFKRKFDWAIDLLGPDHHGYVARTKAAVQALGYPPEKLTVLIVQQVNLLKEEVIVKMSKRAGQIVTMDDLIAEVGKDVGRFFFLIRSANAHLDFDLELAKQESLENPVFYIQYAHARIASIFRKAAEAKIKWIAAKIDLETLDLPEEKELAKMVLSFPDVVLKAAQDLAPHGIAFYCLDLARQFQSYYSQAKHDARYKVVDPENLARTGAKLYLLKNIQIVLQNALKLMGISAPERMERQGPA